MLYSLSCRLPRPFSVDGKKTPEPQSPSKDSCQSPVNGKASWKPSIVVQDTMTSADKAFLTEGHEAKGILPGSHGNRSNSNSLVTTEPHQKSNSPRVRRQTWNEHPVRKSKSLNSLKALEYFPPVLESEDCMGYEVDRVNEGAANGIHPLPISGKETGNTVYHLSLQHRHQYLSRQENVTRDPSRGKYNASKISPEGSTESLRYGENGFGAARKIPVKYNTGQSVKYRTWQTVNKHGELTNKETTETKKQREKLFTRSKFLSPSLNQSSKEEIQIEIPKRKEYVKPRKRVLDRGLETKDEGENVHAPTDKQNWVKALRKVCNANIFLSGMVALRKQRELDRLILKMKQDALEKLFQELKHCRYLRLPSNEDDEKIDFISWVFQKD